MSAFANIDEFLAMGGHAAYVWPAYGVTLLVIVYILCAPLLAQRRFVREERQRLLREGALRDGPRGSGTANRDEGRAAHADRETSA